MRLEIPIKEVQEFLNDQFKMNVGLKYIGEDQIRASFIDSVILIIDEVKENVITFHHELDGIAVIMAKLAHFFFKEKPDKIPVEWNQETKQVVINLHRIPQLAGFLRFVYVSDLHFLNNSIFIDVLPIEKPKNHLIV